MNIDHVTFRTSDLETTRGFLETVLGVTVGYRPPFSFPGYWLYEGSDPVIHLIPGGGVIPARESEVVDHAAFLIDDYDGTRAKLDRLAIQYQTMDLPDLHERRLFLHTPGGILMELVFRSDLEARLMTRQQPQAGQLFPSHAESAKQQNPMIKATCCLTVRTRTTAVVVVQAAGAPHRARVVSHRRRTIDKMSSNKSAIF